MPVAGRGAISGPFGCFARAVSAVAVEPPAAVEILVAAAAGSVPTSAIVGRMMLMTAAVISGAVRNRKAVPT